MKLMEMLAQEYDIEMKATRTMLERVPMDRKDYLPHTKSMTLGRLATHIASMAGWAKMVMTQNELDFANMDPAQATRSCASREELLSEFDANVKASQEAIANANESELEAPWTMRAGPQVIMTIPRYMMYRRVMLNHVIHHRGQLSVYLRLLDVPLPPTYGPSADEAM